MKKVIGIDIGGTNTRVARISSEGKIEDFVSFKTQAHLPSEDFAPRLVTHIKKLCDDQCLAIGVGAPEIHPQTGIFENPSNLNWGKFNLKKTLSDSFPNFKLAFNNDANCAAIAEKKFGQASKLTDYIVITLGTGVGSGVYSHDELINGATGFASELGHTIVVPDGEQCSCGRYGHLEAYWGSAGLRRSLKMLYGREVSIEDWGKLLKSDDLNALSLLEDNLYILATACTNLIHLFSPQAIFLTGGTCNIDDELPLKLKHICQQLSIPALAKDVIFEKSFINQDYGSVLGAAALVL